MFPKVTDAISQANRSIHFMNMNFWLGAGLITKFPAKTDPVHPFDPQNPKIGEPVVNDFMKS